MKLASIIAIAYGAESWIDKANDGKETKRCQIWTDTWLRRAGKWQIVAAQDTIVPCHPYGCPATPLDIAFARSAAQAIRPSATA